MAWHCENCGQEQDSARPGPTAESWKCANCGAQATLASTVVRPPGEDSADSVFQPALMMDSILDELKETPGELDHPQEAEPGTETLETDPGGLSAPDLALDVAAYLLILGASPGQERRSLTRARTSIGRRAADIALEDPAISGLHFQIEAFGKEFFLRDLESRNGTYLNGTRVRYSQLLPGDQITAGKTSLIFRTSDDKIDRG